MDSTRTPPTTQTVKEIAEHLTAAQTTVAHAMMGAEIGKPVCNGLRHVMTHTNNAMKALATVQDLLQTDEDAAEENARLIEQGKLKP
jgi:hypothetical protein